jgi:S-DNA-T family DNA segregation ATPase FtsK/SpoIIIE
MRLGDGLNDDSLLPEVMEFVKTADRCSVAGIQRKYRIGYGRAHRIVEQLEEKGVVTKPGENGQRKVIN